MRPSRNKTLIYIAPFVDLISNPLYHLTMVPELRDLLRNYQIKQYSLLFTQWINVLLNTDVRQWKSIRGQVAGGSLSSRNRK